jgi:SpoVK/Ycf46/Vps4 family AAA+-type ATPase
VRTYIGETEKKLARLFGAAERGGVVLALDEVGSLSSRRTGINDSQDRCANIETNFLLRRLEDRRGLPILAANRKTDPGDELKRRIRFPVTFQFPDVASRLKIWQANLPQGVPTSDLDLLDVARPGITGTNTRIIADETPGESTRYTTIGSAQRSPSAG